MKKITDIIPKLLPIASANREKFATQLSFYGWHKAVGKAISKNTKPLSLKGGRLLVEVKDVQWKKQLEAIKPKLKQKLNSVIGEGLIKDINFILKKR